MRIAMTLVILFSGTIAYSQAVLVPGTSAIQQKWIAADLTQMNWYVIDGANKILIGTVLTQFSKKDNQLLQVTIVKMKQFTTSWTDTTIAQLPSLSPVYHSSYNSQRDMVLKFGPVVSGYYYDLMKKENIIIADTTRTPYFDSNLYPAIIRWLPLKEGYSSSMAIYDYNPRGKIGVLKATIHSVSKDSLMMPKTGRQAVWVVKVADEIAEESSSTYYIHELTRRLLKQEIKIPGRMMVMELEE